MEFVIIVSSIEAQKVNSYNKPENFVTRLDKPVELDRNKRYVIDLDSGIIITPGIIFPRIIIIIKLSIKLQKMNPIRL